MDQRIYLEGLEEEFDDEEGDGGPADPPPSKQPDWGAFDHAFKGAQTRRAG